MLDKWINEIKQSPNHSKIGMYLGHHGVVRESAKESPDKNIRAMNLDYDEKLLQDLLEHYSAKPGIVELRAFINKGQLTVGDTIMYLLVAGRYRKDIFPVFSELLERIKKEVVREEEIF